MTTEKLITDIAAAMQCTPEQIMSKKRIERVADARTVLQYCLRNRGWTHQRIADLFRMDHSSVCHNVRKMQRVLAMANAMDQTKNASTQAPL